MLIPLAAIPANRLAASALAELLSRRQGLERTCEVLVAWAREASKFLRYSTRAGFDRHMFLVSAKESSPSPH